MQTAIGRRLDRQPGRLAVSSAIGLGAVFLDLTLLDARAAAVVALVSVLIQISLVDGDLESLGLVMAPVPRWGYWIRAGLIMGLAVAA